MDFEQFDGTLEERCNKLSQLIKDNSTCFFGGAGVSTASGIPDFRGTNGIYTSKSKYKYSNEELLSSQVFHHNPKVFFDNYKTNFDLREYQPNLAHYKLAELEEQGFLKGIITQNIDSLHQKAGSKNVLEIHGSLYTNHCIKCNKDYDVNYIFDSKDLIPRCTCDKEYNIVKPDITLYGECLNDKTWNDAMNLLDKTKLLIVGGTSLKVNPAATIVDTYIGKLVIINKQETPYDTYADLVFREDITDVFNNINL